MRSILAAAALVLLTASLAAGCMRQGSEGESCNAPGLPAASFGDCAAGFVCTPEPSGQTGNGNSAHWDVANCRAECSSNTDCTAPHTSCRAVAGAEYRMACQAD